MFPASVDHQTEMSDGCYDGLYAACGILWPARAGRMVVRATAGMAPGRALDAGCGDGKNAAHLIRHGWIVDAFDVSKLALASFERRMHAQGLKTVGNIWQDDLVSVSLDKDKYDLVVAYGVYHCLTDDVLPCVHTNLLRAVKVGGRFVFAAFNNQLPVPERHGTGDLSLRPRDHIPKIMDGWETEALEFGIIHEHHRPIISEHCHALTWGIFRKVVA